MDPALLDTDMLSEVLKQRNSNVRQHSRQYLRSHGQFAFSAVSRFELIRGYKELNATTQLARFVSACGHSVILPVTDAVFDRAANLWVVARQGQLAALHRFLESEYGVGQECPPLLRWLRVRCGVPDA